jgi:anti-sigma factor RsiW
MECPDENVYARLHDGLLAERERLVLEEHIDDCPVCAELLAQIGKVYARHEPAPSADAIATPEPSPPAPRALTWIELSLALMHATMTWKLAASMRAHVEIARSLPLLERHPSIASVAAFYLLAWAPAGWVITLASAWGIARDRPWGARLARFHAWSSLPSVLLTPLSFYVLAVLHRRPRQ